MPIIDLHADTADKIYRHKQSLARNTCHIDIEKLEKGNYLAQWFAIYIDTCGNQENYMAKAYEIYSYLLSEIELNSNKIGLATSYNDYEKNKKSKKISALLSVEEGQIIGDDLANIDTLYDWGVRMMTLTWNYENRLGYPHSIDKGLTPFGKEVVSYLEQKNILIDISHLSEKGVKEIASIYKKPIIASHCNARKLCNHTRNLSDDIILLIAKSGGIIGINFYSYFLNGSHKSFIEDIVNQIDYIYKIGGRDILALGTDFDGIDCNLEVCNAAEMDKLIFRLSHIYGDDLTELISYKNFEKLMKKCL